MALALVYPQPERGRGKKDSTRKESESLSFSYRRAEGEHNRAELRAAVVAQLAPRRSFRDVPRPRIRHVLWSCSNNADVWHALPVSPAIWAAGPVGDMRPLVELASP
jgi:hypothetical protein